MGMNQYTICLSVLMDANPVEESVTIFGFIGSWCVIMLITFGSILNAWNQEGTC